MSRDLIVWGNTAGFGLLIPPWIVLIMQPIVHLPMRISWGVVAFLTFATLVASVPRLRNRRKYQISVLLLTFSYLALRQVADGNLEFLSIAGLVLCVVGYQKQNLFLLAAGIVLVGRYSAPNSALMLLAIGLIPLFQKRTGFGLFFIMLTNAAMIINNERFYNFIALS
jgi:hypothetical protein